MAAPIKADGILLDLDGTLWDAVEGICRGWNAGFAACGLEPNLTVPQLRACMGLLMEDIAARILPQIPTVPARMEIMAVCYRYQLQYLSQHGGTLYPGVRETLETLAGTLPLFIVSNCQDGYIQCFLRYYHIEPLIRDFLCPGQSGRAKAENIAALVRRYGLQHPVYVGDTQGDCAAAHAAGVPFLHAAYGFGTAEGAEGSIASFDQLSGAVVPLRPAPGRP